MKFWLDLLNDGSFTLYTIEDREEVTSGRLSDIMEEGDDWQDALDRYFESRFGIKPNEWEIG